MTVDWTVKLWDFGVWGKNVLFVCRDSRHPHAKSDHIQISLRFAIQPNAISRPHRRNTVVANLELRTVAHSEMSDFFLYYYFFFFFSEMLLRLLSTLK